MIDMLGLVSFSVPFLPLNFTEGAVWRVSTLVLSHSAPQPLQSSKTIVFQLCLSASMFQCWKKKGRVRKEGGRIEQKGSEKHALPGDFLYRMP